MKCWLEGQSPSYKLITSTELQLQKFSFDFKAIESYENEFQQIKVGKDFDGESVNDFAEKFWAKVLPISKLHDLVNDGYRNRIFRSIFAIPSKYYSDNQFVKRNKEIIRYSPSINDNNLF